MGVCCLPSAQCGVLTYMCVRLCMHVYLHVCVHIYFLRCAWLILPALAMCRCVWCGSVLPEVPLVQHRRRSNGGYVDELKTHAQEQMWLNKMEYQHMQSA